jgi:hypothetical protein
MFVFKIGRKSMNRKAWSICRNKQGVAWIAEFLFVTKAVPSEI